VQLFVIASKAKQSSAPSTTFLDCFVASLLCNDELNCLMLPLTQALSAIGDAGAQITL
jgi:hypothetical protein